MIDNRKQLSTYLFLLILVLPSLIWIFMNVSVWTWDEADYGNKSITLFTTLINEPSQWLRKMLNIYSTRAPMISWIGQFFIIPGLVFNSIDSGLLLSVLIVQFLTLILLFKVLREMFKNVLISYIGCLIVASAPISVFFSITYFVEPLQLFSVVWFLYIMVFARKWDSLSIFFHLVAASSFAMLAKVSSPLYCLGPGLVATWYMLVNAFEPGGLRNIKYTRRHIFISFVAVLLAFCAGIWYWRNFSRVLSHIDYSTTGSRWGADTGFFNKFAFWLGAAQDNFFIHYIFTIVFVLLIVLSVYLFYKYKYTKGLANISAIVAIFQIILVLSVFSSVTNEDPRFLLPVLPYCALLICWSISQINRNWVSVLVLAMFISQVVIFNAWTFGVVQDPKPKNSLFDLYNRNDTLLEEITEVANITCSESNIHQSNVIGVVSLHFNRRNIYYQALKNSIPNTVGCNYKFLGDIVPFYWNNSDVNRVWEEILSLKPAYYITLKPDFSSTEKRYLLEKHLYMAKFLNKANEISLPLLKKVESSKFFKQVLIPDHLDILLFKYIENVKSEFPAVPLDKTISFGDNGRGSEFIKTGFAKPEAVITH